MTQSGLYETTIELRGNQITQSEQAIRKMMHTTNSVEVNQQQKNHLYSKWKCENPGNRKQRV